LLSLAGGTHNDWAAAGRGGGEEKGERNGEMEKWRNGEKWREMEEEMEREDLLMQIEIMKRKISEDKIKAKYSLDKLNERN